MTPTHVRPARPGDLAPYLELAHAERGEEADVARPRFEGDLREEGRRLFVATAAERFAGYGRVGRFAPLPDAPPNVAPAGCYLFGVLVDPALRRSGIGRALTRARMAWAFERAGEVWFFANAGNEASLRLHAELGFEEVTRDFWFPRVTFAGGAGVLCRAARGTETRWYARAP
jgi:ribosomal protein S18 acetylase RimI-like enzyme